MSEDDEDVPQLSLETFAVLQEFYKEQEERESRVINVVDADNFEEDWMIRELTNMTDTNFSVNSERNIEICIEYFQQLSQFWYDEETIDSLTKIAVNSVGDSGKIALISCPSLYRMMKEKAPSNCEIHVYEFDQRFASFGSDFHMYDYKSPLDVPRDRNSYYDLVIADPPFLSDECLTKTAVTIKFLAKKNIILCTGATMADMAKRLLNLEKAAFEPNHKNNLANEFWCYSNYCTDTLL